MLTDERIHEIWMAETTPPKSYREWLPDFARAVEREARRETLEEAARVCSNAGVMDCAAAIRALIEQEPRT